MRAVLIEWIYEVSQALKLKLNTYFLAVSILDNFTVKNEMSKKKFQKVGITALQIAAKMEEIYPPRPRHFVQLLSGVFNKEEIIQCECEIMKCLNYKIVKNGCFEQMEILALKNGLTRDQFDLAVKL